MAEILLPDHPAFIRNVAQTLLKHHNAAILWSDAHLRLRYISNNTYDLLAPFQTPPGLDLTDLCPELFGLEDILEAIAHREIDSFKLDFVNRDTLDGDVRYINIAVYPAPDPTYQPGLLLLIEDATDTGVLIQELNQKRNELRLLKEENSSNF
jgi:hypothetical protein